MRIPLLLLACASVGSPAADLHVPGDQPTIQQAIDLAQDGDRVLVAPGTYHERVILHDKDLQLIGTGGAPVTMIDADWAGTVVTIRSHISRSTTLSGFTLIHGKMDRRNGDSGGGLLIANASPTVADNEIRDNEACFGGAVAIWQGAPRLHHNHLVRNTADCGEYGGAVSLLRGGGTILEDNVIEGNAVTGSGAGGGIAVLDETTGRIVVARNLIRDNSASEGSGIFWSLASARISDNVIVGNHGQGDQYGVGLFLETGSDATIDNNTIADNVGGELYLSTVAGALIRVVNNVLRTTAGAHSVQCVDDGVNDIRLTHNLIHAPEGATMSGPCDVAGPLSTEDPRFAGGKGAHAYRLSPGSPAIDVGDNLAVRDLRDAAGEPRIRGWRVDLGAYESHP